MVKNLFLLLFAIILSGCCSTGKLDLRPVNTNPLVSADLLDHAGLDANWQVSVSLQITEKIDRLIIHGSNIFVLTDENHLICLDRTTGKQRFSFDLTSPDTPLDGPGFYEDQMFFMSGKRLIVVNMQLGVIIATHELQNIGPSAAAFPVRNSELFYIASSNRRMFAVDVDGRTKRFALAADNDSVINNLLAEEDYLVFSTDVGNIVSVESGRAKKIWQFDLPSASINSLVKDGPWIYAASADTKLYKIEARNGQQGWKAPFHAGTPLTFAPRIGKSHVYQYAKKSGFYAINKTSGKQTWHLENGVDLLCESNSVAYVFDVPGQLTAMHNITGEKLFTVNVAEANLAASNTIDSQIYIANSYGRIMAISPQK